MWMQPGDTPARVASRLPSGPATVGIGILILDSIPGCRAMDSFTVRLDIRSSRRAMLCSHPGLDSDIAEVISRAVDFPGEA